MPTRQNRLNKMGQNYISSGKYTETNHGQNSVSYALNDKKFSGTFPDLIVKNNCDFQSFMFNDGIAIRLFDDFSPSVVNIYHETVYVKIDGYIVALRWNYDQFDQKSIDPDIDFLDHNFIKFAQQDTLIEEFKDTLENCELSLNDPKQWFETEYFVLERGRKNQL